jgi:hypothetical protein
MELIKFSPESENESKLLNLGSASKKCYRIFHLFIKTQFFMCGINLDFSNPNLATGVEKIKY